MVAVTVVGLLFMGGVTPAAAVDSPNPCLGITSSVPQLEPPSDAAYQRLERQMATPITDGQGYTITAFDAWYFKMTAAQIANWRSRQAPMSLSPAQYISFIREFYAAADADGLDGRLDIRLKGSAGGFWSNPTKAMPSNAAQAAAIYFNETDAWPTKAWCRQMAQKFAEWLGPDRVGKGSSVPAYRPFNSLYVMGISKDMSDIDVALSSAQAGEKITEQCTAQQVTACQSSSYGFFSRKPTAAALPNVTAMMARWSTAFGFDFTFSVFPAGGPNNYMAHYQPTDWAMQQPCTYPSLLNTAPDLPIGEQSRGPNSCPLTPVG